MIRGRRARHFSNPETMRARPTRPNPAGAVRAKVQASAPATSSYVDGRPTGMNRSRKLPMKTRYTSTADEATSISPRPSAVTMLRRVGRPACACVETRTCMTPILARARRARNDPIGSGPGKQVGLPPAVGQDPLPAAPGRFGPWPSLLSHRIPSGPPLIAADHPRTDMTPVPWRPPRPVADAPAIHCGGLFISPARELSGNAGNHPGICPSARHGRRSGGSARPVHRMPVCRRSRRSRSASSAPVSSAS